MEAVGVVLRRKLLGKEGQDDGSIHQEAMAHIDCHQHRRFRERDLCIATGAVLSAGGE